MKNIYEKLRTGKHKNNNEMEKGMTITELVRELNANINGKKLDRNVIARIENGSQQPTPSQLVAYSKVFDVSIDFILTGEKLTTRSKTEKIKSIADYLGISDESVENILNLTPDHKIILDKMISRYCLLLILPEIRNLLGYNYLRPHLKLVFEEKKKLKSGAEIDQYLNNAINDDTVSTFFNEAVSKRMKQVIDNTMDDEELKKYFGDIDKHSKISSSLPASELPKLREPLKESDD